MDAEIKSFITKLLDTFTEQGYITPDEVPDIPLYMDQITTFMDTKLEKSKRSPEDKILTKTMINNYTKNNLVPPPVKKKYSKEHLLMLIFVYYLKDFLSISDIETLLSPLSEKHFGAESELSLSEIYGQIVEMQKGETTYVAKDLIRRCNKAMNMFKETETGDREYLQLFSLICLLSFDVYVKKQMITNLIDKLEEASDDQERNKKKRKK